MTAFTLVQRCRSHVKIGKGKCVQLHHLFLRMRMGRGDFLIHPSAMHSWISRAADICCQATPAIKNLSKAERRLNERVGDAQRSQASS